MSDDVSESASEETTVITSETSTTLRTSAPYITTTPITTRPVTVSTTTFETTTATTLPPMTVDPDTTYSVVFTYDENGEVYWATHGNKAQPSNFIVSVYEKDNQLLSFVHEAIKANKMLYVNIEKASDYSVCCNSNRRRA